MKYYIIAGEASGDLHGSNLVKALKQSDPEALVHCWGGDLMQAEGAFVVKNYRETAFMGLFEVMVHLRTIAQNLKFCKQDILKFSPDVVILIDYPGFNLQIAKFAKANNLKVYYYISPKVWVWKESRVKTIKQFVDKMFVIFPFEKPFYAKHNYEVDFVGNPLIDAIEERKLSMIPREEFLLKNKLNERPIVSLLPGSRKQEITRLLPIMTGIVSRFPGYQFVVACTSAFDSDFYQKYMANNQCALVFNQTYQLLNYSTAAVVASGTATLETALFNIPQVVCYRMSHATYILGKPFVPVKYFSLVNIIMDKEVVKELLQYHLDRDIVIELGKLLYDCDYREKMLDNYTQLREKCGGTGASKRVGELIVSYLNNNHNS